MDGTGQRHIVSGLSSWVDALSLDHDNRVCWYQYGKAQRTVYILAPITYAAQCVDFAVAEHIKNTENIFNFHDLTKVNV